MKLSEAVTKRIWYVNYGILSAAVLVLVIGVVRFFTIDLGASLEGAEIQSNTEDNMGGQTDMAAGAKAESPLVMAAQKYAWVMNPPPPPPRTKTPPTVPQDLKVTGQTKDTVALAWTAAGKAAEADPEVKGYKVYQNGAVRKTVTGTEFKDEGLKPETEYKYTVSAINAMNDESAVSAEVAAKTEKAPPPRPPSVPQEVKVTASTYNSVSLSWQPSVKTEEGHPEVKGYKIYQNGTFRKETAGTEDTDAGLNAEAEYRYTVTAVNTENEESAPSAEAVVRTEKAPVPKPPDPTFALKGTVVIGDGGGYAIVKLASKNFPQVAAWGEVIEEYKLVRIADGTVELEREGYKYSLEVPKPQPGKTAVPKPGTPAAPVPGVGNQPGIPPTRPVRPTRPIRPSQSVQPSPVNPLNQFNPANPAAPK